MSDASPDKTAVPVVPNHLGLILDGNRRWAKAQGKPPIEGHRQGAETFRTIVKAAFERGVKYISAYVFSTENWTRAQDEVSYLMGLLLKFVEQDLEKLHAEGIRVVILGSRTGLDRKVAEAVARSEALTKDNTRGTLALCFNYGGQQEIVEAVQALVKEGAQPDDITADAISAHLYHPEVPPVDMIIRTSGEQRLSNFMLWRGSYAELLFVPEYWPAFSVENLDAALAEYAARQRRFGG